MGDPLLKVLATGSIIKSTHNPLSGQRELAFELLTTLEKCADEFTVKHPEIEWQRSEMEYDGEWKVTLVFKRK